MRPLPNFNYRGREPLLVSPLIRHKDGGGEKYISPPVFKEGIGVVFSLLSKSDSSPPTADLSIMPYRIETL